METKYRFDAKDERLWNGDQPVQITNKACQLLRLFVSNENRLLTKDDILKGVWHDVWVSESLVKEYVHDLRQALGDDPKNPRFIETVHGRGYRFLGGIEELQSKGAGQAGGIAKREPTLAVLPIENLTGEERWGLFCQGLRDDLIIDLARYPNLIVIADKALNGQEGVASNPREYALGGTVQASDHQVRVNIKLMEAGNGAVVWTEQYERDIGEFFAIQSDIVGHVASAVGGFGGQIPHAERLRFNRLPPENLQTYELYLLSHELESHFQKETTLQALEMAQRAVALDPHYSRAWLVQGWCAWQILLEHWAEDRATYARLRREAFEQAARLDPRDPVAIMERAQECAGAGDSIGARDGLERALDLGRNQADLLMTIANAIVLILDEPVRAQETLARGLELIAVIGDWQRLSMARVAYFTGDFAAALENARQGPDNLLSQLVEFLSLAQMGEREQAAEKAEIFRQKHPQFEAQDFIETYPITAQGAQDLLREGCAKAGLA
jgi:TolB-like protein